MGFSWIAVLAIGPALYGIKFAAQKYLTKERYLKACSTAFKKVDTDESGLLNFSELHYAVNKLKTKTTPILHI